MTTDYKASWEPRISGDPAVDVLCASSASCSFDQTAAHNGCCKFAREAVVKTSQLLDRYKFEAGELKGAARYQPLELRYSHFVQAPGDLAESRGPIRLKRGPPTDKGLLAEY